MNILDMVFNLYADIRFATKQVSSEEVGEEQLVDLPKDAQIEFADGSKHFKISGLKIRRVK